MSEGQTYDAPRHMRGSGTAGAGATGVDTVAPAPQATDEKHPARGAEAERMSRPRAAAFWVGNFCLPIAFLVVLCCIVGVQPFGPISFLTEDLMYQYIDFFTWFKEVLAGNANLFYSGAQALGTNTWGLFSYYLSSPFNLLIVFFSQDTLPQFVWLISALKLGCIQCAATAFLRKRFGLSRAQAVALALCFTWSSWTMAQLRNPEWMDVLIFLPLAAWGVWALVVRRRWRLLVASVFGAVVTCWYTAYMLVLFLMLYFVVELCLAAWAGSAVFTPFKAVLRFGVALLGALMLAAFTFVPTVLAMSHSVAPELDVWNMKTPAYVAEAAASVEPAAVDAAAADTAAAAADAAQDAAVAEAAQATEPAAQPSEPAAQAEATPAPSEPTLIQKLARRITPITDRLMGFSGGYHGERAQFFCSTAVLVLAGAFLFFPGISGRTRILGLIAMLLLVAGCVVPKLYYIWCGFRVPNGFFCRTSFFAVFFQTWMAAYFIKTIQAQAQKGTGARVLRQALKAVLIAAVLVLLFDAYFFIRSLLAPAALVLALIGIAAALVWTHALVRFSSDSAGAGADGAAIQNQHRVLTCSLLVLAVLAVELMYSAVSVWRVLYSSYTVAQHEAYVDSSRALEQQLSTYDAGQPYRMAKTYQRSGMAALNEGMAMGYQELSSYSSSYNPQAIAFLNDLGYSREGEFSTRYAVPILASDSFLGVKYVSTAYPAPGFEPVVDAAFAGAGQEAALQRAAGAADVPILPNDQASAALYQNPYALPLAYGVAATAPELGISNETDTQPFEWQNAFASALVGRDVQLFKPLDATCVEHTDAGQITGQVQVPAGSIGYAYMLPTDVQTYVLKVAGVGDFLQNFRFQDCMVPLSWQVSSAPTQVTVQLVPDGNPPYAAHESSVLFYALDMQVFEQVVAELRQNPVAFETYQDGYIKATYPALEDAVTPAGGTIPADAYEQKLSQATEDGLVMFTIPNAAGWDVTVNGQKVEPVNIAYGALMGVPVQPGANVIELRFTPPGLVAGCVISGVSVLALVVICVRERRAWQR